MPHEVPSGAARIYSERRGAGPAAVLCEGGPGAAGGLGKLPELLATRLDLVTFHQRGVGRSGPASSFELADFVADLEALREAHGLESWVVLGHSWGAGLALLYALEHPARTRALGYLSGVGIDPGWHARYHRRRLARLAPADRARFEELRAARAGAAPAELARIRVELARLQAPLDFAGAAAFRRRPRAAHLAPEVNAAAGRAFDALLAGELPARLAGCRVPALVLHGAEDPRDPALAREVAAALPQARYVEVEGAGHYPWVERPEAVLGAVGQLVEGLE